MGEVDDSQARAFRIGVGDRFANRIGQNSPHVVSIEKVESTPVLPDGLTVSEDGSLLNWLGENYVRQHVTFQPGDTVRRKDLGLIYSIGEGGYYSHGKRKWFTHEHTGTSSDYFTSERFEKISLG